MLLLFLWLSRVLVFAAKTKALACTKLRRASQHPLGRSQCGCIQSWGICRYFKDFILLSVSLKKFLNLFCSQGQLTMKC